MGDELRRAGERGQREEEGAGERPEDDRGEDRDPAGRRSESDGDGRDPAERQRPEKGRAPGGRRGKWRQSPGRPARGVSGRGRAQRGQEGERAEWQREDRRRARRQRRGRGARARGGESHGPPEPRALSPGPGPDDADAQSAPSVRRRAALKVGWPAASGPGLCGDAETRRPRDPPTDPPAAGEGAGLDHWVRGTGKPGRPSLPGTTPAGPRRGCSARSPPPGHSSDICPAVSLARALRWRCPSVPSRACLCVLRRPLWPCAR